MSKQKTRSSPPAASSQDGNTGLAQKFMRENPVGKLTDPIEVAEGRDKPFAGDLLPVGGETPETVLAETLGEQPVESGEQTSLAEGEAAGQPGEAAAPPTPQPQAEASDGGQLPQAAVPVAETPKAEAAPAPSTPKLDRDAKYELGDGIEWTGEQILAALHQRAETLPKAEEADKFSAMFGGSYAEAEARWKPVLEQLAANPARTAFLEEVLGSDDPQMLDYLQRSAAFYKEQVPGAGQAAQPAAAPTPAADPRLAHFEQTARAMEQTLVNLRVQSEKAQVFAKYPFLQTNEKARQAIFDRAAEMYALDEKNGVPMNERRGLLDAMQQQTLFLDSMAIAHANATSPRAVVDPAVGAQRLLPGSGPGAVGTARPAPPREYRGDPDKARDQFITDYPD